MFTPRHKWLWIAGSLSGASTVIMGDVGGHKHEWPAWKKTNQSEATKYGLTTSVAMLISSCASRTSIPGLFLLAGNLMFTGPLYYRCHTDDSSYNKLLPIGGTSYILGYVLLAFL